MRFSTTLLAFTFAAVGGLPAVALAETPTLSLEWVEPESYRDIQDSWGSSHRFNLRVLDNLEDSFTRASERHLKEGKTLELKVFDVDVEGDFEPFHRSRGMDQVRIVKEIYPPALKFTYILRDANGAVLSEGEESLRNLALSYTPQGTRDRFPHTARLFEDWVRRIARE